MRLTLIVTTLFALTACGKKESAPAPEPAKPTEATKAPEPKPEPKPEPPPETKPTEPPPETKPAEVDAATPPPETKPAEADAAAPASDDLAAAVNNLIAPEDAVESHEVAVYVVETKTLYYTESYSVEGTGVGLNLIERDDTGKTTEHAVEIAGGAGEDEKPLGKDGAKKKLTEAFTGKTLVVLDAKPWPVEAADTADAKPAKSMTLEEPKLILTFAANKIGITDQEGKAVAEVDVSKEAVKPHQAVMGQVFVNPKVKLLVIEVGFDPGEKYAEGFNNFTHTYVVSLP